MTLSVTNDTGTRLLFSIFNSGDAGIPFYADWIEPEKTSALKTGDFKKISLGIQAQEGGRWIGKNPADQKFDPNVKLTVSLDLKVT